MALLLLIVIYVLFISLGLPDGVFGGAWPAIRITLDLPVGLGAIIGLVTTGAIIISSLLTSFFVRKIGIGQLVVYSTVLTTAGLFGFSISDSLLWLLLAAVPLGLGAGAIDSAINNYVANHYGAHHMSWLHAFWGVGAVLGPSVIAFNLANQAGWEAGFTTLALIQLSALAILVISLPLWSRVKGHKQATKKATVNIPYLKLLKSNSVKLTFVAFFLYVGLEFSFGLWLTSYLIEVQAVEMTVAVLAASLYYGMITVGRIVIGAVVTKLPYKRLVAAGIIGSLAGSALLFTGISTEVSMIAVALIGLSFAPIYPGMIHQTPNRFGTNRSAKVMSLQMVAGYLGATTIMPLIGLLASVWSLDLFAYVALGMLVLLLIVDAYLASTKARWWQLDKY